MGNALLEQLKPLPEVWYYENVNVELIMIEDAQSVYRFTLPLAGSVAYILYNIISYPVPVNERNVAQYIRVKSPVAIDTRDSTDRR